MKTQLLTLLFLIPFFVYSQSNTKGSVLGVQLGTTKDNMMQIMKSKGYTPEKPNESYPMYKNVKFGAFSDCTVAFYFVNDKMYQALIILDNGLDSKVIERYESLNSELSKKYGKGESYRTFKTPYEEGDGYETTAIKLGKADFNTFWNAGDLSINSYINTSLLISVKYQDSVLIKEVIKARDSKNLQEY